MTNPQEGGKHTPGPWRTDGCYISSNYGEVGHAYWVSSMPADMSEANARLMAAAPALLEALDLAVAILQEAEPRLGYAEGSLGQIEIEEAIETGLAALLQATGGENGR